MLTLDALLQNRYRIYRQIGGGGMGTVYLAEDNRLPGRCCAVKEMTLAYVLPEDRNWIILAFQQEAQMLVLLHHPGLTAVTDFFAEAGNWYLVMDYVDGETLEDRLLRTPGNRLPLSEVLDIARQLCDVLEYLHGQTPPVIFRDLKPGNVMLTPQGQVKLIDFGIARFFKPGRTQDTVNLGTPGYAAPEQYGSLGQSDARTDVYSLGILLHQMLTGYDPTTTPMQLPSARALNPDLPLSVETVIQRATQPHSNQRFQSIYEFRQALFAQASGLLRGQSVLIGLSAVVLTILVVGLILANRGKQPQNTTLPTVAPPVAAPAVATLTRAPSPTATSPALSPSPMGEQIEIVQQGEGLFDVCYRHCPDLMGNIDALNEYLPKVVARNGLPKKDPLLRMGQSLIMPPCP